jgi:hypothetical protein
MRRSRLALFLVALGGAGCRTAPRTRADGLAASAPAPIESIAVPATGGAVTFRTALLAGELYLLRATGSVALGSQHLDAEYAFGDGATASDLAGDLDVGLDIGIKQILPATGRHPAPPCYQRLKWFGAFRSDHAYHLLVTGGGLPLSVSLVRPTGGAGTGVIDVALFPLTPSPALATPLETVLVPAREKISVRSQLTGAQGAVYLLQAAGEVQVGGPGHMGDAEFHDYKADGRGHNQGENGVDFGVGIDEPVIGAGHDPRHYKWGEFRTDHTYYLLYAGTGQPIGLNYHDTGGKTGVFKDNEGSLPVTIFRVP